MVAYDVRRYDEVISTNELVKQAIEQGVPEGLVCRAAVQTGGYGRQGRSWSSPRGGLYQSLLLRPAVQTGQLPTLGLVVALSVRRALVDAVGLGDSSIQVKWPNDVVCAQGKLSGISSEVHAGGVCVGIGVNVFHPAADTAVGGKYAPAYLAELPGALLPGEQVIDVLGDVVLDVFARDYETWLHDGFAPFVEEYAACSALAGQSVRIEAMDGSLLASGLVTGIDAAGRLLVETASGVQAVSSGEAHIA